MGQPTAMSSVVPGLADAPKNKNKNNRNGYRAKELAEIRNSLRPFEQGEKIARNSLRHLNGEQLRQLNSEQLRQLNGEQLRQLNGEQLRQLNGEQLRQLNGEQLRQLNGEQLRQLNGELRLNGDVRQFNGEQLRQHDEQLRQYDEQVRQFDIEQQLRPFDSDLLRTASSLSESSSTSEGCIPAQEKLKETLNKLALMGYDEATAIRAVSLGDGRLGSALDILHRQFDESVNRVHCVNGLAQSDTTGLTAVVRKTSNEVRGDPFAGNKNHAQTKRCESPGTAPALPPRSVHQEVGAPPHPPATRQYSPGSDNPPPLPPPRGSHNPPPTPPRGSTPPPPLPPHSSNMPGGLPPLYRRVSPVPGLGVVQPGRPASGTRGTSPVARHQPLLLPTNLEVAQQMHALSLYPGDLSGQVEPPPPYPMGSAALTSSAPPPSYSTPLSNPPPPSYSTPLSNPPPSYSQTLAMRQSPTLSSASSDYRRSPGLHYPLVQVGLGHPVGLGQQGLVGLGAGAAPTSPLPCPSPVSSILSGSSRSSSMQAWSARQAKTHSPIIMQSVKSTQVQKPVLQTACAPASPVDGSPPSQLIGVVPRGAIAGVATAVVTTNIVTGVATGMATSMPPPPPPSYAQSIQQKQQSQPGTPIPPSPLLNPSPVPTTPVPSSNPPSYNASIQAKQAAIQRALSPQAGELPPPPPYPSTAVPRPQEEGLVPATPVLARGSPVINTAKVVPASNANLVRNLEVKSPLQRKYSPHMSETSSTSRSDSPASAASDCPTVSASPVSFMSSTAPSSTQSETSPDQDNPPPVPPPSSNEMPPPPPPPYKTTHHTSPIPERKSYSREKEESRMESKIRNCPPQAFKFFMEQHIENVIKTSEDRRKRRMQLEKEMLRIGLDEETQEQMRKMLCQKESNHLRAKRSKMDKTMFKRLKTIGIGAFGEVALVRKVDSPQLCAMKTLKKLEVLKRNQVAHVKAERDILAEADNEWVVKLYYSFQDRDNLYFVMEYIPGGDLMSLLIKFGIFKEPLARFYISELVCAVDSVHKMGFIHRDIKPDNILIDANGHIKLTDFGLCTGFRWTHNSKYYQNNDVSGHSRQDSMDPGNLDLDSGRCSCPSTANSMKPLERRRKREHARCLAHSLVGTPNYIAPEVLLRQGYTQLCDWWSVGVIMYEMLVGQPPFLANSPAETQYKVINWEKFMCIPRSAGLSTEAKDLILALCTSHDRRIGGNGTEEIKQHSFFSHVDFSSSLRSKEAPYKPSILFDTDTSNFDPIDPEKLRNDDEKNEDDDNNRDYHGFYEFTFRRFFDDAGHPYTAPSAGYQNSRPTDDNENPSGPVYV